MKAKFGDIEGKTRERRRRRTGKDVLGYVQAMAGKRKLLVQFEDEHKKDMSSCLIQYLCLKKVVCLEMDETISNRPKK